VKRDKVGVKQVDDLLFGLSFLSLDEFTLIFTQDKIVGSAAAFGVGDIVYGATESVLEVSYQMVLDFAFAVRCT
jgi:hypothetical protein